MHVGIDVDGVLRALLRGIRSEYVKDYPEREKYLIEPEAVDSWGIEKMATNEKVGQHMKQMSLHDPKFSFRCFYHAPPIEGEVKAVERLYEDLNSKGHIVSICTSQDENPRRVASAMWLMDNAVPYDNLITAASAKGNFGLDILFDDRVKNCRAVEQSGGIGVLKNRKYNDESEVRYSANSIEGFHKLIKSAQ